MADPPAWFVIPVMPGLWQQITGVLIGGAHGNYKVVKTFVNHPLYNDFMHAGYGPPYSSYADAVAAAQALEAEAKANALGPGIGGTQAPASINLIPGVKDIGSFFHALGEKSTWIRVGEVLAGAVVLYAGLKSLTSGTPVGEAGKTVTRGAKKAAKITPIGRAGSVARKVSKKR